MNHRNYGLDLLRFVLMFMVCVLHVLGQGGILEALTAGSLRHKVFWLLEISSYCAVDSFAMISGYTAQNRKQRYEKIVSMWFQAFFYSFVLTIFLSLLGIGGGLGIIDIKRSVFLVTFGTFWYFTAFVVLFFAMPLLNKFLFSIDEVQSKRAFLVLIFLFSVMGSFGDPFKSQIGYSAIWLLVLYCIGVLMKRVHVFAQKSSLFLMIVWGCCIFITWFTYIKKGDVFYVSYISPTIVLSGMIMVILFSRLRLNSRIATVVSKLSPYAFGIYLFQSNPVIWNTILKGATAFVVNERLVVGILYVFFFAFLIFISGLFVEMMRSKIDSWLNIPLLSQKIVYVFDKLLLRLFRFFV
ncbi:acyltransferase family protein [Streptococcus sp. 19428wC2_LYSM12]|uniref:acyltransferase family protein n=1 Tax=unclassified Streptococcus TaxID=2608887 RepID=UPI0010721EF2|nr:MULTISPECIES: acyltransferase family protein [unclassified Streptococcus]MBF0787684.1 acyltransferase family protein [Streptococcus sp. 19428wC2_LYSM12]TFV05294.1 hypothetical protein E4T79_07220 [Streptococcus sp. LYSM12]